MEIKVAHPRGVVARPPLIFGSLGPHAKQGMRPLLAHEVRPCSIYGEAVLPGWPTSGILPLISSTPCRRIRSREDLRDQFTLRPTTHFPRQLQLMAIMMVVMPAIVPVTVRRAAAHEDAACRAKLR